MAPKKKELSRAQLIKANKALQSQVEFLIGYTDNLSYSYNLENQRLAKRCSDLEKSLESELTYRDWDNLKEEIADVWDHTTVQRLNDWIKNSDNPLRYELLLEYIYDIEDPAFRRLQKKAEVKLALLEKGVNVAQETKLDKIIEANPVMSKSVIKRLATQLGPKTICPPDNMIGYTADPVSRGRSWRKILKEKMDAARPGESQGLLPDCL